MILWSYCFFLYREPFKKMDNFFGHVYGMQSTSALNPSSMRYGIGNMKLDLQCLSFLHTESAQVVELIPYWRQGTR